MKNSIYLILICILMYSCANIGAPTGGDKDIQAPVLLTSIPKHESVEYKGKIVVLEFDEEIELNNLKKNLVITPSENNEYKHILKGNVLKLEFDKPFSPNTTYVLNFGESISDVTERNKVKNLRVAFSTGNFIDSLRIEGEVIETLSLKSVPNCLVGIYRAEDTLDIQNSKPLYFTYTDSLGFYKIENIKTGKYKLYALQEGKKTDSKYNAEDERIGFIEDTLALDYLSRSNLKLRLVRYDNKPLKVLNAKPRRQYFEINANKDIYDCRVIYRDSAQTKRYLYTIDKNIVRFYNPSLEPDSTAVTAILKDSIGNILNYDTKLKFDKSDNKRKAAGFVFDTKPSSGAKLDPTDSLRLTFTFNKPLLDYFLDSLKIQRDQDTIPLRFTSADVFLDSTQLNLKIRKPIFFKELLNIEVKDKAFVSIENDTTKTRPLMYNIKKATEYGSLSGILRTTQKSYWLQLLDANGAVEAELRNPKTFEFKLVTPGKKKVRVLIDDNGNGKWETGDLKQKIIPESVKIFDIDTEVKANWVVEDVLIELDEAKKQSPE